MKRCPKCNRSYPDDNQKFCTLDGGLLVSADQAFDPNATILATTNLSEPTPPAAPPFDMNRTVASSPPAPPVDAKRTAASASAPTEILDRHTGPTGNETVIDRPAPRSSTQPQSAPLPQRPTPPPPAAIAPTKKSKVPMIIGLLLLLLVLGVGAIAAAYFVIIRPRLEPVEPESAAVVNSNENTNTATTDNVNVAPEPVAEDAYVPPPGAVKFTNSAADLDGRLAERYFDFSFYYPNTWQTDPGAGVAGASNFAKVERRIPPDFTQENFAVGWYTSKGTFAADEATFPQLVEILGANLAKGFPGYRKVSEGPTKINSLDGYEFRFESESKNTEKGDIKLWGRVVFLPSGVEGQETGATLIMLATSLAPEISGVADVGEKGEMPVILDSFRFGSNKN
jgi:hypothetical protein